MNKSATSKELLLKTAKNIVYQEGISKLSIRRVASESGIAIGTVYNYYPAKSDLVIAVMSDFWHGVFHRSKFDADSSDFLESYRKVFFSLKENFAQFESCILNETEGCSRTEQAEGRRLELMHWEHMKEGMLRIFLRDPAVRREVFTDRFSERAFIEFAFSNLLGLLRDGTPDCGFLLMVFERLVYGKAGN